MKKTAIMILVLLMLLMTGCSSGGGSQGQTDEDPGIKEEETITISDKLSDIVKLLSGKNLYIRDEFFKGDFTNPIALGGNTSQYVWTRFSINEKEMTLGTETYHLTGEVKGYSSDGSVRFETQEATCYLMKDEHNVLALFVCEKGKNSPVGVPYIVTDYVTYWKDVEAWNKHFLEFREEINVKDIGDSWYQVYRTIWFGVDKNFYDAQLSGKYYNSVLVIRIEKSQENYDCFVELSSDHTSATATYGDVTKYGTAAGYAALGVPILPYYNAVLVGSGGGKQYEEGGKIWFCVYNEMLLDYNSVDIERGNLKQKIPTKKISYDIYMNHFFLPKNYK